MKKFSKNILGCVCIAMVVFIPLAIMIQDLYDVILNIGRGSFILGIALTPLIIIGGINLLRGFGAVLEMDEAKYGNRAGKGWKFYLYLLIHIVSYLAVFYAITNCL